MFHTIFNAKQVFRKKDFHLTKSLQKGRGMIELLGVLALIGVLSIVALTMYSKLQVKNTANDIYDDIQRRTFVLWDKEDLSVYEAETEIPIPELKENPYDVSVYRVEETENDGAAFVVEISNLTRETCVELLHKPFATPYMLQVGDREFDPSNPDYSVCDIFDEAAVTLFVSSAWAVEGKKVLRIPFGLFDLTLSSPSGDCKNEQTYKSYTGDKKECCLDYASVVPVQIDGYNSESCCPLYRGNKANEAVPVSGGKTLCCYGNEQAAFNPDGGYRCCSYPLPVLGGTGEACCGSVNYDTGEMTEVSSMQPVFTGKKIACCLENGAYKKEDGFYGCCSSLDTDYGFATDIFGKNYQTCCDVTQHAYVNDNGEVQCCQYSNTDGGYNAFVDVIGAPNPRKTCCLKIMKSSQFVGYFKNNQSLCCDGSVYKTESDYECCAIERGFDDNLQETITIMRQVVDVVGAPKNMQTCCETTKEGNAGAVWKNGKATCCEPEDTVFQTLEKEYGCCNNSAEFLDVIGFPQQQYCCEKNQYAYWTGTGYGCHSVRGEIKLIEGYPNTDYEVVEGV